MKTKIRFVETEYYVNSSKCTIVCKIHAIINGFHYTAIGVAKCSPEDTFDEIKGKRIAESRAKSKVYKTAVKYYSRRVANIRQRLDREQGLTDFCNLLYTKEVEHVKYLCNV